MAQATKPGKSGFLPPIGSASYHGMLGAIAILILGPLGGITAAYMNFSLGFFVGGQVLAGILGSVVTYGYGPEGKHGANYMQTMAASVASMGAMGVLIQAMVWLGLPIPPAWQLVIYFLCIGMLGVGIGMLYTPLLVDRMQLTFPSGLAVANILRALTDKRLLKKSVGSLGTGTGLGFLLSFVPARVASIGDLVGKLHIEISPIGAGMIVGARIGVPAIVVAVIGHYLTPYFVSIGYLKEGQEYRIVGFLIALGTIMGAAVVDLVLIFRSAIARFRSREATPATQGSDDKNFSFGRLALWIAFWATATIVAGRVIMHVPLFYLVFAVALCFLFVLVNGISLGISDSNPISSAFVLTVVLMVVAGLKDQGVGLLAGAILLVTCSVGCDMQQDRSTGWRLGSNRRTQFRYQVMGVTMGAVCAVFITTLFLKSYPVLNENLLETGKKVPGWSSAMTLKFVGALKGITDPKPWQTQLLLIGLAIGVVTEALRKIIKNNEGYKRFRDGSSTGKVSDFVLDAIVLPSPYASSFGGFVPFAAAINFGVGGIIGSLYNTFFDGKPKSTTVESAGSPTAAGAPSAQPDANKPAAEELPEDMATISLIGGGLIGGDALAMLLIGIIGLISTALGH
ncbi:MAG: peptide transporter [Polyangiaceae bacterium]|nr:peptide transporter [Polyangiaceae bacterium]